MSHSDAYDRAKGEEEHILHLPGGRQLAYAHNGPPSSRIIVLFYSGLMSVGNASNVPAPCQRAGVHWVAPTLPGFGNSTVRADLAEGYHLGLVRDIVGLIDHLYPTGQYDAIYLAGGSYGTAPAQMLYGAPYHLFPPGRKVVGCLLLGGFSPFKYDKNYGKSLTWPNWFSIGPPAQWIPFHLLQRLASIAIASKLKSLEGAKGFLNMILFSKMDAKEERAMAQYLERKGTTREEFIERMAQGAMRSTRSWDGFYEVSDVLHSDWGFNPATLDAEHASKPVLILGGEDDDLGGANNAWLVANYRSAKLKTGPGGHISAIYYMDEIFEEFFDIVEKASSTAASPSTQT
ncbi:hypothetical protein HJFPF1_03296 [Paramyrothecium foliicola]|nr:hypothetical protein HJFPF1_03296 [Paramyrothecium foliicola]